MDVTKITPAIVRAAFQSAAGRGIAFPSVDFEEFVAHFLNGLREVKAVSEVLNPLGPRFLFNNAGLIQAYAIFEGQRSLIHVPVIFDGLIPDVPQIIKIVDNTLVLRDTRPLTYECLPVYEARMAISVVEHRDVKENRKC
jgi:hypothetical protein